MGVSGDMTCHFYPGRMAESGIVGGGGVSGHCTGAFFGGLLELVWTRILGCTGRPWLAS